ncbi:MAG: hypothetical protein ABGX04_06660 [Myxococcales bacterium]
MKSDIGRQFLMLNIIDETIAFPIESQFNLSDPRLSLGLRLFAAASIIDRVILRNRS